MFGWLFGKKSTHRRRSRRRRQVSNEVYDPEIAAEKAEEDAEAIWQSPLLRRPGKLGRKRKRSRSGSERFVTTIYDPEAAETPIDTDLSKDRGGKKANQKGKGTHSHRSPDAFVRSVYDPEQEATELAETAGKRKKHRRRIKDPEDYSTTIYDPSLPPTPVEAPKTKRRRKHRAPSPYLESVYDADAPVTVPPTDVQSSGASDPRSGHRGGDRASHRAGHRERRKSHPPGVRAAFVAWWTDTMEERAERAELRDAGLEPAPERRRRRRTRHAAPDTPDIYETETFLSAEEEAERDARAEAELSEEDIARRAALRRRHALAAWRRRGRYLTVFVAALIPFGFIYLDLRLTEYCRIPTWTEFADIRRTWHASWAGSLVLVGGLMILILRSTDDKWLRRLTVIAFVAWKISVLFFDRLAAPVCWGYVIEDQIKHRSEDALLVMSCTLYGVFIAALTLSAMARRKSRRPGAVPGTLR